MKLFPVTPLGLPENHGAGETTLALLSLLMTRADTWWMRSEKRPVGHRQKLCLTSLMSSPRLELRLLTGVSRDCLPPCVGPLNLCAAVMREECWAGGGRANFFLHTQEGQAARSA